MPVSCPAAVRGIVTPADRQAAQVSPEQSKAPGPSAPQRYGLPRWARAKATARDGREPEAGRPPGDSGAATTGRSPVTGLRSVVACGAASEARTVITTRTASPPPGAGRRGAGGTIT